MRTADDLPVHSLAACSASWAYVGTQQLVARSPRAAARDPIPNSIRYRRSPSGSRAAGIELVRLVQV